MRMYVNVRMIGADASGVTSRFSFKYVKTGFCYILIYYM